MDSQTSDSLSRNGTAQTSSKCSYIGGADDDEEFVDGEEEEEEITPAELILKLQQSWLNEKLAPELLEHKTAVVECIIEQIKHMENNIKSAKKGDFRIAIHKLEIEQFASIILEQDNKRHPNVKSKLSPEEFAYATEYLKNVRDHLTASILDHLPINLQDLNEQVTMAKPDMDKFVFLRANENVRGVLVDDMNMDGRNEIIDMDKNDLYVIRYKPIGNYVNSEEIQLI